MRSGSISFEQLRTSVGERFQVQSAICSSRCATALKALDRSRNVAITVWLGRHRMDPGSPAEQQFLNRMNLVLHLHPPVASVLAVGRDVRGVPYLVLEHSDAGDLTADLRDMQEAERRFLGCLRLVDRLHRHALVHGDLCAASFRYQRNGEVSLASTLGALEGMEPYEEFEPGVEDDLMAYIAPEMRAYLPECTEYPPSMIPEADVYSLGALGYRLFTGQLPFGANPTPPSDYVPGGPPWLDEVLLRCLAAEPEGRYSNADAILKAISAARERHLVSTMVPVPHAGSRADLPTKSNVSLASQADRESQLPQVQVFSTVQEYRERQNQLKEQKTAEAEAPARRKKLILGCAAAALVIGVIVFLIFDRPPGPTPLATELEQHEDLLADKKLQGALRVLADPGSALSSRILQLQKLKAADDPLVLDALIRIVTNAGLPELRREAEVAILERAERMNLTETSALVREWLADKPFPRTMSSFLPALRLLERSLPFDKELSLVRNVYADEPVFGLRLALARALDMKLEDKWTPELAKLVGDQLQVDSTEDRPLAALVFAAPALSDRFASKFAAELSQLPAEQIDWLIDTSLAREGADFRSIAFAAQAKLTGNSLGAKFLDTVAKADNVTADVLQAAVRVIRKQDTAADLETLLEWQSPAAEDMAWLLVAIQVDEDTVRWIADKLATRTLRLEPAASLFGWIRAHRWEERGKLVAIAGKLQVFDALPPAEVDNVFAAIEPLTSDANLLNTLLAGKNVRLIEQAISRFGRLIPVQTLTNLLEHEDPTIRLATLGALKSEVDARLLASLLNRFERERDPKVREAYKETLSEWKNRGGKLGF